MYGVNIAPSNETGLTAFARTREFVVWIAPRYVAKPLSVSLKMMRIGY